MEWNATKVLENIRQATNDDLIERITAYRAGLDPDAIGMIEDELRSRGVKKADIEAYLEQCLRECLYHSDGVAKMCSKCRKPAVKEGWGWHRLMGKIPIVPRWLRLCKEHAA